MNPIQRMGCGVLLCLFLVATITAAEPLDVVILNGRIVDGTGAPWYKADVGIAHGKIVVIGKLSTAEATTKIDAQNLVVAPGFIDMMGQNATALMSNPAAARNLLTQGITTINCGEGDSAAPLSASEGRRLGWTTMREYMALLDSAGLPVNVVQSIGHTQVRSTVLGDTDRRPSAEELERMRQLVREGMQAGAIGVSTALIYPPAVYATTQEIAELAKVAGEFGGRYYTHMRNEGDRLLEAIDEALEIGREANTPVHIFHLKTAGQQNWGKMPQAIARIKAARAAGQQVAADVYPYINNGLSITALVHPRHAAAGIAKLLERLDDEKLRAEIRTDLETTDGWENWYRHVGRDWDRIIVGQTDSAKYRDQTGQSIAAIAKHHGEQPWDTFFNLLKSGAFVLPQSMSEANKILAIQQEFISYCTDVGPAAGDAIAGHPRAYGSFPKLLGHYVRDLGVISLERCVAGASAVAANEVMAYDRGRIAIGLAADVVIFDYSTLADKATFAKPDAESIGIKHVLVNGVPVLKDGQLTKQRPGRVLRGPGYRASEAPAAVTIGKSSLNSAEFDRIMQEFVSEHAVPGVAVAVSRYTKAGQSEIVLQKGYGYADLATLEKTTSKHLYRIASISKPITAIAILKLIENGKFTLDDPIVELLKLQTQAELAGDKFDARWNKITVRHLLQHRGGWDRDKSFDAMFQSVRFARQENADAPAEPATIVSAMLKQRLDFEPGERYAYSNFGYCLLGRLIEKVSGESYEKFVQDKVLRPIGIEDMRLGHTRLEQRADLEVRYYQPGKGRSVFQGDLQQTVPTPYGAWNLEAMDAHGGWLASAEDLLRLAMCFDDPAHCPVLSADSIKLMFEPPSKIKRDEDADPTFFYSLGWMNRISDNQNINRWHTGSLDGTATIMIRRHDGWNMVALLNTRSSPVSDHLGRAIDRRLHAAVNTLIDDSSKP